MHLFGSLGSFFFIIGVLMVVWLLSEKAYHVWWIKTPAPRVTTSTLFYLSLTTVIIGVQLFMTGFLGELMVMNSSKKNDYLISDKTNADS